MTIADIARDRGTDPTETYLDLVGELGSQTRIMNWNYSGRDDEEASLRKVLAHSACCFETDTILTGNGVDNPASYGTFPRLLGRYVRELQLLTLPEAVRRMTGFTAERMGLARSRPHRRRASPPTSSSSTRTPSATTDAAHQPPPIGHRHRGAQRRGGRERRPLRSHIARRTGPAPPIRKTTEDTELTQRVALCPL